MSHPALSPGRGAIITGGASGIGFAVAQKLVALGMQVCLADRDETALAQAVAALGGECFGQVTNVADLASVEQLRDVALARLPDLALLMNNAGTGGGGGAWQRYTGWQKVLGVNVWGVVHGLQTFTQIMIDQGRPAAIVNTGSKQGITNPPGDAAYNVSKAGVRSVTESLAHELRNVEDCLVTAHLLVPGFTYTGLIKARVPQKPPAAWLPEQVADLLISRMAAGDFYIICPDNDVTADMDYARIQWNTDDIIHNRPALSRWHPDYVQAFEAFMSNKAPKG
jgi:NAD(P)-dependent dehydrogenase (short-subunit alcohol dehydrogenase family)